MSLKFKTRGISNPQGKQKVYFCAHPEDFELYFDSVSDEILAKQDCAVFYYEQGSEKQEFELNEMNLFVMPITTKLLTTENEALNFDFEFAKQHNIPVLPLMQESNLEKLFNEKCGDLQFLDKNNRDVTAISYDEKLEKYLSSVLIGDEQAEKIRAAFDAYIFLSYRKKDRKHAQELMRLIHKNDFCRDIAIWYDEFLTPGENFNESIQQAMEKSKLFALAVTPNLVNEENYVQKIEYPAAKESGKPIIPAEMVETNKDELKRLYADIPDCTNAHDDIELKSALMQAVENIAIRENDSDPEHNFFIGLAYLNGIDVEVDRERALKLITSAAEANLPEAIEKLVYMYNNGEGVERDYNKAIEWQRKLVEYYKRRYEEEEGEDNGRIYLSALWNLGISLYFTCDFLESKMVMEQVVDISSNITKKYNTLEIKIYTPSSYHIMAYIYWNENDVFTTFEYLKKCVEIYNDLYEKSQENGVRVRLAIVYISLGDVCLIQEDDLSAARDYYEKSYEISKGLNIETSTPSSRRVLAMSYDRLGKLFKEEGDFNAAREHYEKNLELTKEMAIEEKTVALRSDLSNSFENLGVIYEEEGSMVDAREYYEQVFEVDQSIASETQTEEAQEKLAKSLDKLGYTYISMGNFQAAQKYYEQSLDIRKCIAEKSQSDSSWRNLALSYDTLADVFYDEEKRHSASFYYSKGLAIYKKIANETGTDESYDDLAYSYYNFGYYKNNTDYLRKAYDIYCMLSEKYPDNTEYASKKDELEKKFSKRKFSLSNIFKKKKIKHLRFDFPPHFLVYSSNKYK